MTMLCGTPVHAHCTNTDNQIGENDQVAQNTVTFNQV